MHRLRRLHDGMSSNSAVRVRSGAGRAEGDLPAVPASRPQHLYYFAPRHFSLRGRMPHPSERGRGYVTLIAQGRFDEALQVILRDNPIPSICGRICTHPCTTACTRDNVDDPVNLPALKRFITDHFPQLQVAATHRARTSGEDCHCGVGPGRPSLCLRTPAERLWHDDLRGHCRWRAGCSRPAFHLSAYPGPC